MRSFVPRIVTAAEDRRTAPVRTTVPWSHAFQRTADRRAGFASVADGCIALDDFHLGSADGASPACYGELLAVARVPAGAARVSVATDVAIDALAMRLVVRAGLARARLSLALSVRAADGDELGGAAIGLVELAAAGPDLAERALAAGAIRAPMACSWTVSAPVRALHVAVRAAWDVDCGADGQFLIRGRAVASAPVVSVIRGSSQPGPRPAPRRLELRSLPPR
jgi:hypothetical protein